MNPRPRLSVALTPCPNDTFVIGAVVTGKLRFEPADIAVELHDIEHLNEAALAGRYDVVKISCATYAGIAGDYTVLDTGAAVADGYGPMVLARDTFDRNSIRAAKVVAPGAHTTAALLYRLWAGPDAPLAFAPYDEIIERVASGEFDAGVIIHESRFTYRELGLGRVIDLGAWWRDATGRPLALGCYVMRSELHARYGVAFDDLLRVAMARAARGDEDIERYIRAHAQELDERVIRQHIGLYVNDYTRHLGAAGHDAVRYLAARCAELDAAP